VRLFKRFDGTVLTQDCPVGLHAVRERLFRVTGALLATLFGLLVTAWGAKSLLAKPANNGNFTSSRFSLRDFSRRLRNTFYPRGEVVGEICVPPPPRATPRGAFVQGAVCVPPPPTPTLPTQNP
jgi:hypothetical protein